MIESEARAEVETELARAQRKFPPFNSPHEGFAIIMEEFEELWMEIVKQYDKRDPVKMRAEAKQIAAMAIRFMVDLT